MEELRTGMATDAVYGLDFWKDCCREAAAPPKPARSTSPPAARPVGRKAAAKGKGKGKGKGRRKRNAKPPNKDVEEEEEGSKEPKEEAKAPEEHKGRKQPAAKRQSAWPLLNCAVRQCPCASRCGRHAPVVPHPMRSVARRR